MVRGNWQKRVETAKARRQSAKQRKQHTENIRQYKQWTLDFLEMLDRCHDNCPDDTSTVKLKVWSDAVPGGETAGGAKHDGDVSNVPTSSKNRKGSTYASFSHKESNAIKKKVHPRSKKEAPDRKTEDPHERMMCRSYFFTGRCSESRSSGGGKKSVGCPYMHDCFDESSSDHDRPQQTLFQALSRSKNGTNQLKDADDAVQAVNVSSSDDAIATKYHGAMEVVFFLEEIVLNSLLNETGDDGNPCSWSTQVTKMLTANNLKLSNVVYVVVDEVLVLDRHREGLLFETDREFLLAVMGDQLVGSRRQSFGNEKDESRFQQLPGPILEHILTFLPDAAVASSSQVCQSWHHEIGKNSPNLWKYMLDRRSWPHPRHEDESSLLEHQRYRKQYLEHLSVLRDVKAVRLGLRAIVAYPRYRDSVATDEMVFQSFWLRKESPPQLGECVAVCVWSHNRVLAAYSYDCSLRLFEAVPKKGSNGEKCCKEQVCVKVDLCQNTKKRCCTILSMDMDEAFVASLCEIETIDPPKNYSLVIVSRSNFLLGESLTDANSESPFHVIDITERVLHYLVSLGRDDGPFEDLFDYLSLGGEPKRVNVEVSRKLIACGSGNFMIVTNISIPDEDGFFAFRPLGTRIFLLSVSNGAIIWMGDAFPTDEQRGSGPLSYAHVRHLSQRSESENSLACSVARSAIGKPIGICEIKKSGQVEMTSIPFDSSRLWEEFESPLPDSAVDFAEVQWLQRPTFDADGGSRPIVITPTDVVCADTLELVRQDGNQDQVVRIATFISFFSRRSAEDNIHEGTTRETIVLREKNMHVQQMVLIRQDHILLVCYKVATDQQENEQNATPEGVAEDPGINIMDTYVAVIVHVPTRREMNRVLLSGLHEGVPRFTCDCNETVGVGLQDSGIVLTGNDVRSVLEKGMDTFGHEVLSSNAHKKRKKRQPNQGNKKDGFARGMTLRG